ncbi:MAG: VanZ family protein [Chitinophagaceae bacterium]|nr:VanZ family protein [Chitinophagaceae bacterium]
MTLVKQYVLFLLWLVLILYLSFTPLKSWPQPTIFQKLYIDKVVHFIMYSVLSFLLIRSMFRQQIKQLPRYEALLIAFIFSASVGVAVEFLQPMLTEYRKFEWMDMVANAAGALGGVFIFKWLLSRRKMGWKAAYRK